MYFLYTKKNNDKPLKKLKQLIIKALILFFFVLKRPTPININASYNIINKII